MKGCLFSSTWFMDVKQGMDSVGIKNENIRLEGKSVEEIWKTFKGMNGHGLDQNPLNVSMKL